MNATSRLTPTTIADHIRKIARTDNLTHKDKTTITTTLTNTYNTTVKLLQANIETIKLDVSCPREALMQLAEKVEQLEKFADSRSIVEVFKSALVDACKLVFLNAYSDFFDVVRRFTDLETRLQVIKRVEFVARLLDELASEDDDPVVSEARRFLDVVEECVESEHPYLDECVYYTLTSPEDEL